METMESFKRKLTLSIAMVFALTSITLGIIGTMTAHNGGNNLGAWAPLAAMVALGLTLIYTRLRRRLD